MDKGILNGGTSIASHCGGRTDAVAYWARLEGKSPTASDDLWRAQQIAPKEGPSLWLIAAALARVLASIYLYA